MKLSHRRQFLHLAAGAAALPAVPRNARPEAYPMRSVRFIVGFAAGGGADIVARIMGQGLSERLGQQVIVENKAGGGANIAVQTAVSSPADGYTLLLVSTTNAVNATFYESLPFNFQRDIAPVAGLASVPLLMVVNPSVAVGTLSEFIAYAKAKPGKIAMASYGTGTLGHLAGELFKTMAGVSMVHVPYRGEAPALTDMIGGQVQMMFATASGSMEHIKSGKLRALAVSVATRWDGLPEIPTVGETFPGYEASGWWGVGAPRNTPAEIIDKLNKEINAALADSKMKARLADLGATALTGSPTAFGKLIADDTEKWRKVIKASGIRAE
jgi:tripartite-type tricarboxylate transporter receptor subunit TctC